MWQRLIEICSTGRIGELCRRAIHLASYGTEGYPPRIRRRLQIMTRAEVGHSTD